MQQWIRPKPDPPDVARADHNTLVAGRGRTMSKSLLN